MRLYDEYYCKRGTRIIQGVREKIYSYVCELAREITQQMLQSYDEELAKSRDKKVYREKENEKHPSKPFMAKLNIPEMSIVLKQRMDR